MPKKEHLPRRNQARWKTIGGWGYWLGILFVWDGPVLVGRTHTGRVTVDLLEINRDEAADLRRYLILEGSFSA